MIQMFKNHFKQLFRKGADMGSGNKLLLSTVMAVFWCLTLASSSVLALPGYLTEFNTRYGTGGTEINSCGLCHSVLPALNGFGVDYSVSNSFATIENLDSDSDSFSNIDEINARTFPGNPASFPHTLPACTDKDGDGYAVEGGACGAADCNDLDAAINPLAVESCSDGIDNNCNGLIDAVDGAAVNCQSLCTDLDGDGFAVEGSNCGPIDCKDQNASINPWAAEICGDGIDQDCRGSDLPCAAVLAPPIMSVKVNGQGVAVNWTPVAKATGYELFYAPFPYAGAQTIGSFDMGNTTSATFNLWPGAAYYVTIAAYNAQGSSTYSNIEYFIIDNASVPTAPNIALSVNGLKTTVSWPSVAGATGYKLLYSPNPIAGSQTVDAVDLGNVTSFSCELWPGAAYYVTVAAYNAQGSSTYSNIEYFIIDNASVPTAPNIALNVNGLKTTVSWPSVAGATGYKLLYSPNPIAGSQAVDAVDLGNVTSFSCELWPGAAYYVAVQAYNSRGGSSYSNSKYFSIANAVPLDGAQLYTNNCAGCHAVNGYDASGSPDLAAKGSQVAGKFASSHNGQSLTASQQTLMATFLNQYSAPAPPVVVTGQSLYDGQCAGCHAVNGYDASGSPDLAAKGSQVAGKFASSHNGQSLTASQQTLMATFLNQYSAPAAGGGSCTSCHGQPPAGSSSPDRAGSHAVHTVLNGINDCASCHAGAAHNSVIDRGIASTWNAKSGAAVGNSNGTCSSISCHGGVTTPNWTSGSINVDTQCTSCHTSGTSQYNGFSSGRHSKHVIDKKIACTQCHDTNLLRNGHFANLSTSSFEQAPASTIKSSIGYSGGRCSTASCHGTESWR